MNDLLRRQTDLSHKLEVAREAKEIRESDAFNTALERAKQRRIDELLSESAASQTTDAKLAIIAELRAFQAVEQELKSLANDLAMARRHG